MDSCEKKLHFWKSFLWAAWGIPNDAQLMCSVFWTCCKNLFFVMEFLEIFYTNLDTFFHFYPINWCYQSKYAIKISITNSFFYLILLFHLILGNYIVTQCSWKVLHNLLFMIWFYWFKGVYCGQHKLSWLGIKFFH